MKRRAGQFGFSTIEALAALAIVAVALVPLLDLQTQITRAHAQQRTIRAEADARRNALALLRDVNPTAAPEGLRQIGDGLTMRWRATPLTASVRTTRGGQGDGDFDVRLYRLDVDVRGPRIETAFQVEQLGWRQVSQARAAP
jgi:Tfp pilus assembly protein PilV